MRISELRFEIVRALRQALFMRYSSFRNGKMYLGSNKEGASSFKGGGALFSTKVENVFYQPQCVRKAG